MKKIFTAFALALAFVGAAATLTTILTLSA
jgi:hypothetical protein